MYYEIYLDSFFLLQFFMNLYLLGLVNHMLYHVASGKRIILGAVIGAVCSLVPFFLPIKLIYSMLCSFLLSIVSMSLFTFRTFHWNQLFQVLERMLLMTLLLGGVLLFLLKLLPDREEAFWGLFGVLVMGGLSYVLVCKLTRIERKRENHCRVKLEGQSGTLWLDALVDTGNSLVEPISGKPVAVLEESALRELFKNPEVELYRVIPYRSVGKNNGILRGYLLKSMTIEVKGVQKECKEIYVAVCQELLSEKNAYRMILNPAILEE